MPRSTKLATIGKTGLELTRLSFGAATQGGLFQPSSHGESQAVFQAAWNAGIRSFDTAPWYGYGQSELWLGDFLAQPILAQPNGFTLSSKVGKLLELGIPPHPNQLKPDGSRFFQTDSPYNVTYDYSYDGAMRSFEESLERLGLERIDALYIHDPEVIGASLKDVMNGAGKALLELREQGLVSAIGTGMTDWQTSLEFAQTGAFDLFLLAGRYTLLEQDSLPFMDYCAEHGFSVVIGGVFNSGLLADPKPDAHYNYAPVSQEVLERARSLQRVCELHKVPLRAAALQFTLAHPAVASVLIAAQNVAQVQDNVQMFEQTIAIDLWRDLKAEGLLEEVIPTPQDLERTENP
jgi:D-threo-aldose 1-dehydrogenase